MLVEELDPSKHVDEVEEVKKQALKDVNAYDEDDPVPDYSDFKCFLVGRVGGEAVATAAYREPEVDVVRNLEISDSTAELKNVHVKPGYRRKGFGSKLVDMVEEKAREQGYTEIVLRTTSIQQKAHRFYEAKGYQELKRKDPVYRDLDYKLAFFRKAL